MASEDIRWISFNDQEPTPGSTVLLLLHGEDAEKVVGQGVDNFWYAVGENRSRFPVYRDSVTHWMPIPELPVIGASIE